MSEYTQGFHQDGVAILRDGQPMTIEEVLEGLKSADALAAHVEDWREGMRLAKDWHHERDERGYFGCQKEADRFLDWLADRDEGDAPATSLSHLKAQWCEDHAARFMELAGNARENGFMAQADAVEDMAQELKDEADELHRQAKGA